MTEVLRYRPRWWQLPWWLALTLVPSAIRMLVSDSSRTVKAVVVVAVALLFAGLVADSHRMGSMLRPDALVVIGLRRRVVPWRHVQQIDVTKRWGTEVVSVLTHGKTYRLRAPFHAPVVAPDRDFPAKVETIRTYWLAATSAGSAP